MTALQKEYIFSKWNGCDQATKTRLASEYLQVLRDGEEEMDWLQFLEQNLLESEPEI